LLLDSACNEIVAQPCLVASVDMELLSLTRIKVEVQLTISIRAELKRIIMTDLLLTDVVIALVYVGKLQNDHSLANCARGLLRRNVSAISASMYISKSIMLGTVLK
jgi:hypothetical protein